MIVDEVTSPKNDGTYGSALYNVPIKLNRAPENDWIKYFVKYWNHPPGGWGSSHRPGIASVSTDKIYLNGTTIEEIEKVHRETLIGAVKEANKVMQILRINGTPSRKYWRQKNDNTALI